MNIKILIFSIIFLILLSTNVFAATSYYDFSLDASIAKAYGQSSSSDTVTTTYSGQNAYPPFTLAQAFSSNSYNFTDNAYTWLATIDDNRANITSDGNNEEPLAYFNFTISESKASINWINVTMVQRQKGTPDSNCYYYLANFTSADFFEFASSMSGTTDVTGSINITSTTDFDNILDANNVISVATLVTADNGEGCDVNYVEVIVGYSAADADPPTYDNDGDNSSAYGGNVPIGSPVKIYVNWTDATGLSNATFRHNASGAWANASWHGFSGNPEWYNTTYTTQSGDAGKKICWNQWANDTASPSNWNSTMADDAHCFVVAQTYNPNLTQTLTFTESTTKLGNYFREPTQSFTLTTTTSRIGSLLKELIQDFSLTAPIERLLTIPRSVIEAISSNIAISRIYNSLRTLTETISLNTIATRIANLLKTLSQYFTLTDAVSRGITFTQSVSQSFNINTITSRIIELSRLTSQSFTINIATDRISSLLKIITGPFSLNITSSRISSLFLTITESLGINDVVSRILTLTKSISQIIAFEKTGTFGKTDVGGSRDSLFQNNIRGANFTLPEDGTVTKISVYLTNTGSGSYDFSVLIYNSTLNYIARSEQTLTLPLDGWYNFTFSQPLTSGLYNLAFWTSEGSGNTYVNYSTGSAAQSGLVYQDYNGVPDPISWSSTHDYNISIYATYKRENIIVDVTLSAIRQISQLFTTNMMISRISSLIKSVSDTFGIASTITRGFAYLRTVTGSFITNTATLRIMNFSRMLTQSLNINIFVSRIQSLTINVIQSFVINLVATGEKVAGLYPRTVELILTVTDISGRLLSIQRIIPQTITTNIISLRIQSLLKSVTTTFGIADSVARGFAYIRAITQSFTTNTAITRIIGFYRTISQQLSTHMITTRLQELVKTLSQPILTNAFTTRITILYKSLTQTIGINTVSSRILGFLKTVSTSFTTNIITSRTGLFLKSVSDSFTTNVVISRIASLIKSVSDTFGIASTITRGFAYLRTVTGSFITNTATLRIMNFSRMLTEPLNMNIFVSRMQSLTINVIQSFVINLVATGEKVAGLYEKTAELVLTVTDISGRLLSIQRIIPQSLNVNMLVNRIQNLFIKLSESFSLTGISGRFNIFSRTIVSGFNISDIVSRLKILSRTLTEGININEMILRTQSLIRTLSQQISTAQIVISKRVGAVNDRIVGLTIALSDSVTRVKVFVRVVSQSLNVNIVFNRLLFLIRTILETIGIIPRITPKVSCSILKTEAGCAAYGCYWCDGTCQSTTCPTPTTTTPSGGGGWIFPSCGDGTCEWGETSENCPEDCPLTPLITPILLDTDVNVEAGSEQVLAGQRVYATIAILKFSGPEGPINVNLTYWINDPAERTVGLKRTIVGVETTRKDIYYLIVPVGSPLGTYTFNCIAHYNNATDASSATFQVVAEIPKTLIIIKSIDVPLMFEGDKYSITIVLENQVENPLNVNVTMFFPEKFELKEVNKGAVIRALSEEVFIFIVTPQVCGGCNGFISIKYDGRGLTREFPINVYPPIIKWGWIGVIILLIIILIVVYRRKRVKRYHKLTLARLRALRRRRR